MLLAARTFLTVEPLTLPHPPIPKGFTMVPSSSRQFQWLASSPEGKQAARSGDLDTSAM